MGLSYFKKYGVILVGIVLGSVGGFMYWYLVGCDAGSCGITSSPINSTVWGGVVGGLLFSLINDTYRK